MSVTTIATVNKFNATSPDWSRLYKRLPNGFHRILLEGRRLRDGVESGVAVDDIIITPCSTFSELIFCIYEVHTMLCNGWHSRVMRWFLKSIHIVFQYFILFILSSTCFYGGQGYEMDE